MKITREWLGGSEEIDLSSEEGMTYFAEEVIMDWDSAYDLTDRMAGGEDEIVINGNEAEYVERYTATELFDPAYAERMICDGCGTVGNADDLCAIGEPCPNEDCNGTMRRTDA